MSRFVWISAVVLIADQLTKWLAVTYLTLHVEWNLLPFLNLTLVHNTGAAFGFLSDAPGWQNLLFIGVAIGASVVILVLVRGLRASDFRIAISLSLILGGALGNVVDRLRAGYVIDFIDVFYGHWHWPAFNIADSAISIGAIVLIADALLTQKSRP